mmetsp:Transcript_26545/g.30327  ORF Transcript_26545/g.30327 Transcript_26545/m.30327 type:complete len:604 (-) Transcript_26545:19-1830(-)
MPHCQKETFNRATKSKKERLKSKQDAIARKQKLTAAKAAAELDDEAGLGSNSNNIAPVEGYGKYEIGCEPEPEYHKFNVKKRNKKHLRLDLKKAKAREEKEEEERSKKQQQEEYEKQQQKLAIKKVVQQEEEEEEEEQQTRPQFEYFVFICECCDRRYATKNQFLNHTNSKNHLKRCRLYEELGLIVTHIELRGEYNNEQEIYNDDDDDDEVDNDDEKRDNNVEDEDRDVFNNNNAVNNRGVTKMVNSEELGQEQDESEEEDESDEEFFPQSKRTNMYAGFSDNSSDSNSSSDDDDDAIDDNDNDIRRFLPSPTANKLKDPPSSINQNDDDEDNIYFDELIYQNQLIQNQLNVEGGRRGGETIGIIPPSPEASAIITPISFNDNYDPTQYDINENRLAIVQHRLRKNLAAKGIEPNSTKEQQQQHQYGNNNSKYYDPLEAITIGTTLLQQVLEANVDQLQQKLDAYNKHKAECALLGRQFALSKGNSKAIPSQYIFQKDAADNTRQRANVHHAGSHYHMQMSRSMQFGRSKGLMARHSSQGSRLQASRMTAAVVKSERAATRKQSSSGTGGGKTSNKSNKKRQGRAGGSKKTGGNKESGTGGN